MGNIYGDLLNRDEYVKDIVSIIQNCVDKKTPTTFSIEGEWGQGKTCQRAIRLFQRRLVCALLNAQNLVIISFFCHVKLL